MLDITPEVAVAANDGGEGTTPVDDEIETGEEEPLPSLETDEQTMEG